MHSLRSSLCAVELLWCDVPPVAPPLSRCQCNVISDAPRAGPAEGCPGQRGNPQDGTSRRASEGKQPVENWKA
ncbi:unnamed protein product [Boreogadus saida]